MKKTLQGFIFWIIVMAFILLMTTIGQVLANLVNIKTIMTAVYVTLGCSFIYIFKR